MKIIPGDTNKPKIIDNGKEWNIEELNIKWRKQKNKEKNSGKVFKKKTIIKHDFNESFGNTIANKYHKHVFLKPLILNQSNSI